MNDGAVFSDAANTGSDGASVGSPTSFASIPCQSLTCTMGNSCWTGQAADLDAGVMGGVPDPQNQGAWVTCAPPTADPGALGFSIGTMILNCGGIFDCDKGKVCCEIQDNTTPPYPSWAAVCLTACPLRQICETVADCPVSEPSCNATFFSAFSASVGACTAPPADAGPG